MKVSIIKSLAEIAMKQSEGYKLTKGESTEVNPGAVIHARAMAFCSWQAIEGVRIVRAPKPVQKIEAGDNPYVKKMFVMADLINEECHTFSNLIILN